MRWFKHFTDASEDKAIQEAQARFGHFGYSAYFRLLEIVACQGHQEGETWVLRKLTCAGVAKKLWSKWAAVEVLLRFYRHRGLFRFIKHGIHLDFDWPKVLRLKDDYTRKFGHTPDKVRTKSATKGKGEVKGEVEVKGEEEPPPPTPEKKPTEKQAGYETGWTEPPLSKKDEASKRCLAVWLENHVGWRTIGGSSKVLEHTDAALEDGISEDQIKHAYANTKFDAPWLAIKAISSNLKKQQAIRKREASRPRAAEFEPTVVNLAVETQEARRSFNSLSAAKRQSFMDQAVKVAGEGAIPAAVKAKAIQIYMEKHNGKGGG